MERPISEQLIAVLALFLTGAACCVPYIVLDAFFCFIFPEKTKCEKTSRGAINVAGFILRFILDLLYSAVVAVAFSTVSYAYSYGKVRLVNLLSCMAGFALFKLTLGRLLDKVLSFVTKQIKQFMLFVIRLLVAPLKAAINIAVAISVRIYKLTALKALQKRRASKNRRRIKGVISSLPDDIEF